MENINTILGEKIKEIRKSQGLSQIHLAERIGLSFQQVQKYEKGHTQLTIKRLMQISEALNVSIKTFFDEEMLKPIFHNPETDYAKSTAIREHVQPLNSEELKFLCFFRSIKNENAKAGMLKLYKWISELEKKVDKPMDTAPDPIIDNAAGISGNIPEISPGISPDVSPSISMDKYRQAGKKH